MDQDNSGGISADELQRALLNGNWSQFNAETCRLMIGMFDKDRWVWPTETNYPNTCILSTVTIGRALCHYCTSIVENFNFPNIFLQYLPTRFNRGLFSTTFFSNFVWFPVLWPNFIDQIPALSYVSYCQN